MRPVDLQPGVLQTPNVERIQQQQQTQPQISQQTFSGQLERIAAERPSQVQQVGQGVEAKPGKVVPEEHGDRRRKKAARRKPATAVPRVDEAETASQPGSKIDVRV
jgi:hypothetical protein